VAALIEIRCLLTVLEIIAGLVIGWCYLGPLILRWLERRNKKKVRQEEWDFDAMMVEIERLAARLKRNKEGR
jgi:hypothetical protein